MSKKIVIRADLIGKKCMSEILSTVAKLQGIKSMVIDAEKCTLTVVGTVDPVCVVHVLRKKCLAATIVGVEDDKPKEKKTPCQEACEKACKERCEKRCCSPACEKACKEGCEKACKEACEKGCYRCAPGCCKEACEKGCDRYVPGCYSSPCALPTYGYYGGVRAPPMAYGYCEERSARGECTIQ